MAKLPTLHSKEFDWKGRQGYSSAKQISRSITGAGFYIKSDRTGVMMLFLYDNETMEANEFFDGEAVAFMSPGNDLKVTIWKGN